MIIKNNKNYAKTIKKITWAKTYNLIAKRSDQTSKALYTSLAWVLTRMNVARLANSLSRSEPV